MVKIAVATVFGAIILFAWGALAWTVGPWHSTTLRPLTNEQPVVNGLKEVLGTNGGAYYFPPMPDPESAGGAEQANEQWTAAHRAGPVGMVIYHPVGFDPMQTKTFAIGFVLNLVSAGIVALMLRLAAPSLRSYGRRVVFVWLFGVFVEVSADLVHWNWLYMPTAFSLAAVFDNVAAWLLIGLGMAAIVKPRGERAAASLD